MKRFLWVIPALILLFLPAWQWGRSINAPQTLVDYQLPPGQWCYLWSKLFAQYAFLALTLQIALGLLTFKRKALRRGSRIGLHRSLGLTVLTLILVHAGLFVTAAGLRGGHFPAALFGLHFDQGYYNLYVSMGFLAACVLVVVVIAGLARNLLPAPIFGSLHRLAWLVWMLGFVHSYAIGTEIDGGFLWSWLYLLSAVMIAALAVYRVVLAMRHRPVPASAS